jgi:hypothetical protein
MDSRASLASLGAHARTRYDDESPLSAGHEHSHPRRAFELAPRGHGVVGRARPEGQQMAGTYCGMNYG